MCGICGIIHLDKKPVQPENLQQMMRSLKHRGPDDEGFFIDDNAGFGHLRLSIIDLSSAGHQPMFSRDKRYCLIYNGEVYNYLELRETLAEHHVFETQTDSEVVLNAFIQWGPACLERFNGMFSFVIYDTLTKELFFARDRFGIKPFYYILEDDSFVFASEERALLPFLKNKRPNPKAIYEYLLLNRTDQGDYTFFEGIKKLPHGACGFLRNNNDSNNKKLEIKKWYTLSESLKEPFKTPAEFYDSFKRSIHLRLRSDVPVGVCLSGGLDSSGIVSVLLKEFGKSDLNTFSAVYEKGEKADESKFINLYKDQLEHMHFIHPSADSLHHDLDRFIQCHSEPVATLGPYAQFKVMELAREHVVVTLDGQGADEQLAGYPYFFGGYFKQLLKTFRWGRLLSEMSAYTLKYKSLYAFKYLGFYLAPGMLKDGLSRLSHNYAVPGFYDRGKKNSSLTETLYNPRTLNESLLHHFQFKLEHLLKWEDHNSMNYSLESRVPFLDHHLVERTLSLPPEKIIHKATSKYFFREAMKGVLPETIRTRQDKIGFATPWDKWFRSENMQTTILDILNSKEFSQRGYLKPGACLKDYRLHLAGKINIAKEIWKWLNLELWARKFL